MSEEKTRVIEITAVIPDRYTPDACEQRECKAHGTVRVRLGPDSWGCPTCGTVEYFCDTHWAEFAEAVIQFNSNRNR